jgi:tetratricopeptide (TPR) repeat protein
MKPLKANDSIQTTTWDTDTFVKKFDDLICRRQMDEALKLFKEHRDSIARIPAEEKNAVELVDCCARLLDRRQSHLPMVEELLKGFTPEIRRGLSVVKCARLDLASGVVRFHREDLRTALDLFESVNKSSVRNGLDDLVPVCEYYSARSYYRLGNPDRATELAQSAKKGSRHSRMIAQIEMVEAWNLFGKGDIREAETVLKSAKERFGLNLRREDYIEYCNILSFQARIDRRGGDFESAIKRFEEAAKEFAEHEDGKQHLVCGRVLTQLAVAEILLARKLEGQRAAGEELKTLAARARQLRIAALGNLAAAEQIYEGNRHHRGLGSVHTHRASAHLDVNEYAQARKEGRKAYEILNDKGPVEKAHCLITQSQIELQDSRGNLQKALQYAQDALSLSMQMARRRLKARALIALGRALVRPPVENVAEAKRHYEDAKKLMQEEDRDYLRTEFEDFDAELAAASSQKRRVAEVMLSEVLTRGLEPVLRETERKIVETVYHNVEGGSVLRTARALQTTRNRIRRVLATMKVVDSEPFNGSH